VKKEAQGYEQQSGGSTYSLPTKPKIVSMMLGSECWIDLFVHDGFRPEWLHGTASRKCFTALSGDDNVALDSTNKKIQTKCMELYKWWTLFATTSHSTHHQHLEWI